MEDIVISLYYLIMKQDTKRKKKKSTNKSRDSACSIKTWRDYGSRLLRLNIFLRLFSLLLAKLLMYILPHVSLIYSD